MIPTAAALSRREARWALAQTTMPAMLGVLAYAEGFGLVAAGALVTMGPPRRLVERVARETVTGQIPWQPAVETFPSHLRQAVRAEISRHMLLHARLRGNASPDVWKSRLADTQVGNLRGVELLGHWAGQFAWTVRGDDVDMVAEAARLTDAVRDILAPWIGNPDQEDTARITRHEDVAPAQAPADDEPRELN